MQRERTALDSFPDLNQGSSPNNASLVDDMANPVENRLVENDESYAQRSSGWQNGESSYSANNLLQAFRNPSDVLEWPSSLDGADPRWSFDPSNITDTSYAGNQVNNRAINMQNYASSLNINPNNANLRENDFHRGNTGNSSGSSCTFLENNGSSSQSFNTWGSSCKRKALEGTPGQFYSGGSSSSHQTEDNTTAHPFPVCYASPGNLTISSAPQNSSSANLRNGVGTSRVAPGFFPSSSGPRITEGSSRNFTIRSNLAHHDSIPFETLRNASVRNAGIYAAQPISLPISNADSLPGQISMNPNIPLTQPHLMPAEEPTAIHSYPWNASRSGSSSRSTRERGPRAREEVHIRSSLSNNNNNLDYPMNVAASGSNQINWSHASGTSASRAGPSSGGWASSNSWLPHQGPSSQNHHRLSEAAPWIFFPNIESDSGIRRSHFELFSTGSASSEEAVAVVSGRSQNQSDQRSAALLPDMPGDNMNSLRAFAAAESRNRLIRQVLSAVRRGGRFQAEDYVYIDPFINGFAELHDRHRDLRLDVDNMSYEELLALEEQIGNVNTGVSEDKIKSSMKQRMYEEIEISTNLEPCCICQEHYIAGDDIGILDCTHEFHTDCIKKWLILKNLCPICKKTALAT